jgi:hypothetical protein
VKKRCLKDYYEKAVTRDGLLHYLNCYEFIEIIPIKGNEPIFIFKNMPYRHTLSERYPISLIIHRDSFILPEKKIYSEKDFVDKGQIVLSPQDSEVSYLHQQRNVAPSKTFSKDSIFDKQIRVSDKRYIKPFRDFLRKYGVLLEERGRVKSKSEMSKERYSFVGKEIKKLKGRKMGRGQIQKIYDEWVNKISTAEKDEKYFFSYTTIRRDVSKHLK